MIGLPHERKILSDIHLATLEERPTVGIRARLRIDELPAFFQRAFHEIAAGLERQGSRATGAPVARFRGIPEETVDVEAAFPVDTPFDAGELTAGELPGGRAAECLYSGPYEEMEPVYHAMIDWMSERGLSPADEMWECYLTDPATEPDPSKWQTLIVWPVD